MSGLEVLTILFGVGGLISAFDAGTDLVKKYKEKRKRSHLIYAAPLETSLAAGPPAVRSEYDIGYQNFGQRFAQGDSKPQTPDGWISCLHAAGVKVQPKTHSS
jgi:hypothetical protein